MYTVDLSANVPLYGQELCYWCGAATAQMIRNGYPNAADRLYISQLDLWNSIQMYNSTDPADAGWATDPHGLTGCLQNASNPPGVNWQEHAKTSRDSILFDMTYWMDQRRYPCGVLINNGGHWVAIVGYTTDIKPISGSSPALDSIIVHDPEPHDVGTDSTMSAADWYAGPWDGPNTFSGTWYNKYVAIIEPPKVEGVIKVKSYVRGLGATIIKPEQAIKAAKNAISSLNLVKQPRYKMLGGAGVTNLTPILVREEKPGSTSKDVPYYYIVPFATAAGAKSKTPTSSVSVLINAFSGLYKEATVFGKAVHYLTEQEVLKIVATAMHKKPGDLRNAEIYMMFQPSEITHIRSWPFWRVKVGDRVVYVDQLGQMYSKIRPSIPGD